MTFHLDTSTLNERALEILGNIIGSPGGAPSLEDATPDITESAVHDFCQYRYLFEPYREAWRPAPGAVDSATMDDFAEFLADFQAAIQDPITYELAERVQLIPSLGTAYDSSTGTVVPRWEGDIVNRRTENPWRSSWGDAGLTNLVLDQGFGPGMAAALYDLYLRAADPTGFTRAAAVIVAAFFQTKIAEITDSSGADGPTVFEGDLRDLYSPTLWESGREEVIRLVRDATTEGTPRTLPEPYPFDPFAAASINFGLQVVYRQRWLPLGIQPGEIIRTLPLGPRQSEKVSIKAVRRTKATRQAEIVTSVETATESSAATKDSAEVVREASETYNWHTEASASASFGFGLDLSVKGEMGGESSASSKDSKSTLNDTMQKTASKIRQDTKIIISNEVEETTELSRTSEITNPNDEVAVTYVYSRLQRQYEIHTYLSEVNTCVFVAERVWRPDEITAQWIRRYDWVLARALLDDSFRSDLETIRAGEPNPDPATGADAIDENIRSLMESMSGGLAPSLPNYSGLSGTLPDIFANPQLAYEREVERQRARDGNREQYARSERRLSQHIRDNILHYCQAIWSSEDPDARMMRYSHVRVPINFEFIATSGSYGGNIEGYYAPVVYSIDRDTAPLSDVINPAGPIGFAGNYAVFYLKESKRWNGLRVALAHQRLPYVRVRVAGRYRGDESAFNVRGCVDETKFQPASYEVRFQSGRFEVSNAGQGDWHPVTPDARLGGGLQFDGVRIWISSSAGRAVQDGDVFEIAVVLDPVVEDPELKALRWYDTPLLPIQEAGFYTAEVLQKFREFFPDDPTVSAVSTSTGWNLLSETARDAVRSRLPEYLLRKRYTRQLLLDTNNVLLTRFVDPASTLEPFKAVHRLIDVLSAFNDMETKRLENERRRERLARQQFGDPDVERITVVTGDTNLVALDVTGGDGTG